MRKICHNGDKVLLLSDGQCKSLSMSYTCLSGLPVHIPASKWKGKYGLWLNAVVTLTQRSISGSRGVLYWKCWWFFYVNGKWLDTKAQNRAAKEDVLFSMWRLRGQLGLILLIAVLLKDLTWWFRGMTWIVAQTCVLFEEIRLILCCSCYLKGNMVSFCFIIIL